MPPAEHDRLRDRARQALAAVRTKADDPELAGMMGDLIARDDPDDLAMIIAFGDLITAPPAVPHDAPEEERLQGARQRAREIGTLLGRLAMRHMDACFNAPAKPCPSSRR